LRYSSRKAFDSDDETDRAPRGLPKMVRTIDISLSASLSWSAILSDNMTRAIKRRVGILLKNQRGYGAISGAHDSTSHNADAGFETSAIEWQP